MNVERLSYDERQLIHLYRQLIDDDRQKHMQFFEITLQGANYESTGQPKPKLQLVKTQ